MRIAKIKCAKFNIVAILSFHSSPPPKLLQCKQLGFFKFLLLLFLIPKKWV